MLSIHPAWLKQPSHPCLESCDPETVQTLTGHSGLTPLALATLSVAAIVALGSLLAPRMPQAEQRGHLLEKGSDWMCGPGAGLKRPRVTTRLSAAAGCPQSSSNVGCASTHPRVESQSQDGHQTLSPPPSQSPPPVALSLGPSLGLSQQPTPRGSRQPSLTSYKADIPNSCGSTPSPPRLHVT